MKYEAVIGLEVHAQLNTKTKIFCSCSTAFGAEPNTQTCPICQGHPGVLPVFNEKVLKKAIQAGLALNCSISEYSKFDRKNYFYPDLPKAYQISQFELPICINGNIEITLSDKTKKTIRINRIHMEEDAGKLIHVDGSNESHVDLNRCGVPLIEIVTEPDLRTAEDAYEYLVKLKNILKYLEVSDCNMEEGSLRCDANISIRPVGQEELGTKAEVKNMNSFHNVKKAIDIEIKRQIKVVEKGEKVVQETRLFDVDKNATFSMRSKEEAHDYRYFPDPDLVPIVVKKEYIEELRSKLPELPEERKARFINEFGLPEYDAGVLTAEKPLADYYENAVKAFPKEPKKISNWIMGEVLRVLNNTHVEISDFIVKPEHIGQLFELRAAGDISGKIAKTVFEEMAKTGKEPKVIVEEKGLKQVSDTSEIEKIIDEIIVNNPKPVEQYKSGKKEVIGFFVGQVMKATKGQANPKIVNEILRKKLD